MARATAIKSSRRGQHLKPDAILKAAERVFTRQGYGETSLRQLIAAAGLSTTAFYARFSSREAVLDALVSRWVEDLATRARERLAQARGLEQGIDAGIEVLVEALQERKPLVGLLLSEALANPASRQTLGDGYGLLAGLLAARLERLVDEGEVEPADAGALAWGLVGGIKVQVERWALFDAIDDDDLQQVLLSTARALLPARKGAPL